MKTPMAKVVTIFHSNRISNGLQINMFTSCSSLLHVHIADTLLKQIKIIVRQTIEMCCN